MWTSEVVASQLRRRGRWKVDFFHHTSAQQPKNGFPWAALGDMARERRETMDPQACPQDMVNYVGLQNIQSGTGDLIDFAPQSGKTIRSRSKRFQEDDILFGRLRPYLNKVFLATGEVNSGICSGEFYVLVPIRDIVLPVFLRTILASEYVLRHAINLQTGSSLPRLQIQDLMAIEVPLPPLEQQKDFERFILREEKNRKRLQDEIATLERSTPRRIIQAIENGTSPMNLA